MLNYSMNAQKEVTIKELRTNLADIMGMVNYRGDTIVVTKNSKRTAIIISPEEYERLLDPSKRLTPVERKQIVAQLEALDSELPDIAPEVIEQNVNKAIREVRAKKHKKNATKKPVRAAAKTA